MTEYIIILGHHYCASGRGWLENVHNNGMPRPSDGSATYARMTMYVDDSTLYMSASKVSELNEILNKELQSVSEWLKT